MCRTLFEDIYVPIRVVRYLTNLFKNANTFKTDRPLKI